jgi:hypothetical protein
MLRRSATAIAGAAVLALCAAFVVSFALGLRRAPAPRPAAASAAASVAHAPAAHDRPLARVEVLNGSGRAGMARAATERLRNAGFDVVYFGNATGSSGDSSVVIDRVGNDSIARAVAHSLGITNVRSERDASLLLEATVIVGTEWPADVPAAVSEAGAWRRLVRWLRPTS